MKTIQCVNIEILLSKSTHTHTHTDEYLYKKKKRLLSTSHHLDIETYKTKQNNTKEEKSEFTAYDDLSYSRIYNTINDTHWCFDT